MGIRKAKIICTIGPASGARETIRDLIASGMDVARLNFSHGDHEAHQRAMTYIREESLRQNKVVGILQDLQGIKIRVSEVRGSGVELIAGDDILLYPGNAESSPKEVFVSYDGLLRDVKKGHTILIDDGLIRLEVTGATKSALKAKVTEGGILKSRKGVNFPFSHLSLRAFTEKDKKDLHFGITHKVDYLAISFVRTAQDIREVLNWARKKKRALPSLIAKIEKPEALRNIEEIIESVDGIMVARGDLGVEMPAQEVPIIQKTLIDLANRKGKLVITATQMLESMTAHSRPTRAEASDVANAVLDGTDALMLSAETASGRYPVEAVRIMDSIIRYTEEHLVHKIQGLYEVGGRFTEAVADGACDAARDIGAQAIVVFTHSGLTARVVSKLRPTVPIIAVTPDDRTFKRLSLYWGTTARLIRYTRGAILNAACLSQVVKSLIKDALVQKGDRLVLVASSPFLGKPNVIRLHTL